MTANTWPSPPAQAWASNPRAASVAYPFPQASGCRCQPISVSPETPASPLSGSSFSSAEPIGVAASRGTIAQTPCNGPGIVAHLARLASAWANAVIAAGVRPR